MFSTLKCEILFAKKKISGFVFENVFKLTLIKSMSGGIYNSHAQVAPTDRSELSRGCQSFSFSFVIGISLSTSVIGSDWASTVFRVSRRHLLMTSALPMVRLKQLRSFYEIFRLETLQSRAKVTFLISKFPITDTE